tara:strand:+ start:1326 stop:1649 length:324 start_codon:yes stop_codon:yes gene_type:complete
MASKDKIPLSSDIYIELTTDIADWVMQERYKGNYKKYIYTDEYDTINFTEKGQDIFNELNGQVESVLTRAGIVNGDSFETSNKRDATKFQKSLCVIVLIFGIAWLLF